jgi:hypothetical protein
MIRGLPLLLSAAALEASAFQPPPPIISVPQAPQSRFGIASFDAGPVQCGNAERVPERFVAPLPIAAPLAGPVPPIRFRFRIDKEGRPLSIGAADGGADPRLDLRDLAPALAAWRFAPGAAVSGCEVDFSVRFDSVEDAEDALLYRYAALGPMQIPGSSGGALIRDAFDRLRPPGATCTSDPVPRERITVQFQAIPEVPGGISYSFFRYDIDASGLPVHIRLLSSSGNRALDVQGEFALGRARFPAQPLSGCLYYFFRFSTERVSAPPAPPTERFRPEAAQCGAGVPRRVGALFRMKFPIEFARRPAEGWAIFTYDVAASGALRNVRIVASEPAARFGEEVLRAAAAVRLAGDFGVQRGCVQRVRFVLPSAPRRSPNRPGP